MFPYSSVRELYVHPQNILLAGHDSVLALKANIRF